MEEISNILPLLEILPKFLTLLVEDVQRLLLVLRLALLQVVSGLDEVPEILRRRAVRVTVLVDRRPVGARVDLPQSLRPLQSLDRVDLGSAGNS